MLKGDGALGHGNLRESLRIWPAWRSEWASGSLAALARKVESVCEGPTSEEQNEFRVDACKTRPAWSAASEMPSCSPGEFLMARL